MPKKKDPEAALIDAVLDLTERDGWNAVSLAAAARMAGVPLAEARALFPTRHAVLDAYMRNVDMAVLAASAPDTASEPARDRLFDALMRRFDAMAPRRDAVAALGEASRRDPTIALCSLPRLTLSMRWMLEAAGLRAWGPLGCAQAAGLAAVYLQAFRVWLADESDDMAKTMAALDKALQRAERIVKTLCNVGRRRRRRRGDETAEPPADPAEPAPA